MGSAQRFAAVNTKVRVLMGSMLKNEDYNHLLHKGSVKEIATYLKEHTSYRDVLEDINPSDVHRDKLELQLKKHIVYQYEKLIHYFTNNYRRLFRTLFMRFEIEDLKLYLRALSRDETVEDIKELVVYSGIYSLVDYEALSRAKNLEEFVENLKGTLYYEVLSPFLDETGQKLLFYMEMNLDRLYFKTLYAQAGGLDKQDERVLKDLLGKNMDLLNLEWIYRGLKYYGLSPEELINYTLMGGRYLTYNTIKELCYTENERELMDRMIDTQYGFLFDNKNTLELFMERRIERYLYFQILSYYRKTNMNIIQAIGFMHLLEYEMRDIISIIESKRYGLDRGEAESYLIRRVKGSDI